MTVTPADTPLGRVAGSGRVGRAGVAELVDGDATEGGCGGRNMGKVPPSLDTPLECLSGSGVIRAGVAELVDGDATEGGCGGRRMGKVPPSLDTPLG